MTRRGRHQTGRHLGNGRSTARLTILPSLFLGALITVALAIVAIPLAIDGEWRTVQTGSMEPHISPGDVVLLLPTTQAPGIGDVVAFPDPLREDRDVLHRVVDRDTQGFYITKGDANDIVDPWQLDPSAVIGAQVLDIPKVGMLVEAVSSDVGVLLFLVVPGLFIFVSESKVWYRYIRYGADAFSPPTRGRHISQRGKHAAESI